MSFLKSYFAPQPHIPRLSAWEKEIQSIPDPDWVVIPLEYPGRVLYRPLVKVGDRVKKFQIIGKSEMGHCVHASISGIVKDILMIWTAKIYNVPAVLIQKTNDPELEISEIYHQYGIPFESASTRDKLKMMGVISPWTRPGRFAEEESVSYPDVSKIIIKGHDEEPTVFVNELILQNYTEDIHNGIQKAANLSPKAEIILTVSDYMVEWASKQFGGAARIVGVPNDYKSRIQQVLIPKIAGVVIPLDKPYMSEGIAVIAAEYIRNLENALEGRKPFVYKYLTLSGSGISKAVTLRVPIGTTIRHILKLKNMETQKFNRISVPGPMKGNAVYTELTPLTKTSHGLHLIGRDKTEQKEHSTCINCGRCTQACPVNLQIHLIGRMVEFDMCPDACTYNPQLCVQCGLCAYVCPAHRPLVQFIQMYNKFHGFAHETNHQEIECSPKSTLEGWELTFQNSPVVDSVADSGAGS